MGLLATPRPKAYSSALGLPCASAPAPLAASICQRLYLLHSRPMHHSPRVFPLSDKLAPAVLPNSALEHCP